MDKWADRLTRYKRMRSIARQHGWKCHYCGAELRPIDETSQLQYSCATTWIAGVEYFIDLKTRERFPTNRPTLDHILPQSKKKDNSLGNLVLCCWRCNMEKGNRYTYIEFMELKQGAA
jgi:hypothetical protein